MARLRDPLFHVVVTLGAAAAASGACGQGANSRHNTAAASGASAGRAGGAGGAGGAEPVIQIPEAGSQSNEPGGGALNDPCSPGGATSNVPVEAGAPGTGGEAATLAHCPSQQLRCLTYTPTPTDCVCDLNGPLSTCDCPGEIFTCAVFDPPAGCQCSLITGPK